MNLLPKIVLVLAVSLPGALSRPTTTAADRPNIVIILADDLGYGDLGCYGARDIGTPHLDRMAAEGTRFTDFSVVAALCTPSRAALMTGRYPGRAGLATGVLRPDAMNGLAAEELTLAEVAKAAGYATGCIGKWHLGFRPGMRPLDQGFDSYFGVLHNLDRFETVHFEKAGGMPILRGDAVIERPADPAKLTAIYTQEAIRFIEAQRDKPFFLYVSHAMPHIPFDASPRFKGRSARGLYGDAVEELDDSTGQILDKLRTLVLAEKTLVFFTSDNGPERNTPGSSGPLRGGKHTVFEGGLRVPCLAWWPGKIPAGRVSDDFLSTLDVLPTIAQLAGTTLPRNLTLDGFDILPVLLGTPGARSPRTTLYSLYGLGAKQLESFREGRWKLVLGPPPQLYDLGADLGETNNLAEHQPKHVKRLTKLAGGVRAEKRIPEANPERTLIPMGPRSTASTRKPPSPRGCRMPVTPRACRASGTSGRRSRSAGTASPTFTATKAPAAGPGRTSILRATPFPARWSPVRCITSRPTAPRPAPLSNGITTSRSSSTSPSARRTPRWTRRRNTHPAFPVRCRNAAVRRWP